MSQNQGISYEDAYNIASQFSGPYTEEWINCYCCVYLRAYDMAYNHQNYHDDIDGFQPKVSGCSSSESEKIKRVSQLQPTRKGDENSEHYKIALSHLGEFFYQDFISSADKLRIIMQLVNRAETDNQLGYIAAGPLEDILGKDSNCDAKIDQAVRTNKKMRQAICGVWHSNMRTTQGKTLHAILDKYDLYPYTHMPPPPQIVDKLQG